MNTFKLDCDSPDAIPIFLSHSADDLQRDTKLQALVKELQRHGLSTIVLNEKTNPAEPGFHQINKALKESQGAVVLITPSYFSSPWCKKEINALGNLSEHFRVVVVPDGWTAEDAKRNWPLTDAFSIVDGTGSPAEVIGRVMAALKIYPRPKIDGPVPAILAGCGRWARRTVIPLIKKFPDGLRIVAVTDLVGGKAEFGKVTDDLRDVLSADAIADIRYEGKLETAVSDFPQRPALVVINTPNALHEDLSMAALLQKCDVYTERPILPAVSPLLDLKALVNKAQKNRLFLHSGTQRRLEHPYRLMRDTLASGEFGRLRSIRCTLHSGRRHEPSEWRRDYKLAGGGIVVDEGYHLLDMALWLAQAQEPAVRSVTQASLRGSVKFRFHEQGACEGIETSAFGYVELPGTIRIQFDLTYVAPEGTVYECLELSDHDGARMKLTRDQARRSSDPGGVLVQSKKGETIAEGYVYRDQPEKQLRFSRDILESCRSDDTRPLNQCVGKIRSGLYDGHEKLQPASNECDARFLVPTQELILGIYRLAGALR